MLGRTLVGAGLAMALCTAAPGRDWCETLERWMAKGHGGVPEGGSCPVQGFCDDAPVRDGFIPGERTPVKTLRLHFIVFREDDGSNPAATGLDVFLQVEQINADFDARRFQFIYTWEYADNTEFRYGGDDFFMKQQYAVDPDSQCNVFVNNQGGAYATFPWDSDALTAQGGIVIGGEYFGANSVLSHELGHCLGLWHTHHGVSEVDPCTACWEPADGAAGDETGDFCSDTPPTPVNWSCQEPGGSDPCSGAGWGPTLPESYMSYGTPCWSLFTDQQAGRMQCWFDDVLTSWLAGCVGDTDGSGDVGVVDFLAVLAAWGSCAGCPEDLNGDGEVDTIDLLALLDHWGPCPL